MNNPQQPASPAKAEEQQVQVVMLDTDRYQDLLQKEELLEHLYYYGIDSWDGYDMAIQELKYKGNNDGL